MDWLSQPRSKRACFASIWSCARNNEAARVFYECLGFDALNVVQGYYQGREARAADDRRLGKGSCRVRETQ